MAITVAVNVTAVPNVDVGAVLVIIVVVLALVTVKVYVWLLVWPVFVSVAVTVKLVVPTAEGVPMKAHPSARKRQAAAIL